MIDDALAAFLQQGIAIHIGTRNDRLEPNAAHVPAAVVEPGGTHLVAYVPRVAAAPVLADLEANGQAALVFARPQDHRACQVKGTFVSVRDARDDEHAIVTDQWQGFMGQLEMIGMVSGDSPRPGIVWPCVAIRLKVTALYTQTPGPDAGERLS